MMQELTKGSRIDEAIKRLVTGAQFGNKTVVSVPVIYPSGSHAGVEIEINGDDCYISDAGQGYSEAENYGATEFYKNAAKVAAERFATSYDGLNMFILKTSISNMEAAIVAVANASAIASRDAFEKATIEKSKRNNSDLFDRFKSVFGNDRVAKIAEIKGKHVTWDVHNVVTINDRQSVFEFVADHHSSISTKYMMFSDIRHTEGSPIILNAVVNDIKKISEKGQLISDVADRIVPFNATKEQFQSYATAA